MSKNRMDKRCPRKLKYLPDDWCPLAVLKLKALRNAGHELTEQEESKLPGCPWAINHQMACYCFFKYIEEFLSDKAPSDAEIAHYLNISIDSVKSINKKAIDKIRDAKPFKEIIDYDKK